jgi:hypothetical protein
MDSKKIEELLNKYWNCETSLEEEQELRTYFKGHEIPTQFQEAASLFRYFEASKKKSIDDRGFDTAVISRVNKPAKGKVIRLVYNTMRIAAGIGVLVVAVWFVRKEVRTPTADVPVEDTYEDPKMAFEETKKALMMISKSFGQAEQQAQKIKIFNDAQEEIQRDQKKKK